MSDAYLYSYTTFEFHIIQYLALIMFAHIWNATYSVQFNVILTLNYEFKLIALRFPLMQTYCHCVISIHLTEDDVTFKIRISIINDWLLHESSMHNIISQIWITQFMIISKIDIFVDCQRIRYAKNLIFNMISNSDLRLKIM